MHFVRTSRRKADRLMPLLICQEHLSALSAEDQAKYAACNRDCGCSASDCWHCDDGEADYD